jgi:Na+/H+-dicarboxylate symporter
MRRLGIEPSTYRVNVVNNLLITVVIARWEAEFQDTPVGG